MRRLTSILFLASALAGALLVGTVAAALSVRVEDVRDTALAPQMPGWIPAAVPLDSPHGSAVQRLQLYAGNAAAVVSRQEIEILFGTFGRRVPLERGTLTLRGCVFSAPPGTDVENNAVVRFVRTSGCRSDGAAAPVSMTLDMIVPSGHPLVAWTFRPPGPVDDADLIFVGAPPGSAATPVLRGRYVDKRAPSRFRRVHLLNHLWQLAPSPYWMVGLLAVAGLVFSFGAFLALRAGVMERTSATLGAGAACLALALGILYAFVVPPFEAPDEPDHFLAFAELAGRPDLASGAENLARIGHLERIRFHGDERFRPMDVDHPFARAWDEHVFPMPIAGRSQTTQAVWSGVAWLTRSLDTPASLLAIRLANAAILAIAVGLGVALLAAHGADAAAFIVSLAFLLVPTLPFFGVHVSEFAALTATYIVFASLLAAFFLDGSATHRLGLPLGVVAALIVAGGRSGAPMLPLVAAALAGRALLGTRATAAWRDARRQAAIFWVGFTLGAAVVLPAMSEAFGRGLWPGDAAAVPEWFKSAAESVRNRSAVAGWLLLLPAGMLVELAARDVRVSRGWLPRDRVPAVRVTAYLAATAVVGIAIASLWVQMPSIPIFTPGARPPLHDYVGDALASAFTIVRLRDHDLLLSTFFWAAFGWLDTLLPPGVVTALVAVSGAVSVWLLLNLARSGDVRRLVWLGWLVCGWTAAVVMSTVGSYFLQRNLHGRYLVGVYLASLAIVWTAPLVRHAPGEAGSAVPWRLGTPALIACAALHAYALCTILARYLPGHDHG